MAELLHSLLGNATQSLDEGELRLALQSIGAELKTADNSFIPYDDFYSTPSFSYVRFQSLDRDAERAFELLRDIVGEPVFDEGGFTRAKSGLLGRVQKDEGSAREVVRAVVSEALEGESARSDVFGTPASVESITLSDLRDFAPGYLDPRQFLFVIASGRPLEEIRDLSERTFGTIETPSSPLSPDAEDGGALAPVTERLRSKAGDAMGAPDWMPSAVAARFGVETREVGAEQSYVSLVRGFQAPEDERAVLTVANGILSDRLAFQLREREGLAYSIGSSLRDAGEDEWVWTAAAGTRAENLGRLSEGFADAVETLLADPPSDTEVRKTAASLYGRGLMRRATRLNLCYYAGLAILDGRDPLKLEERERALESVTADAVTEAVRSYWKESPGLLVVAR